MEPKQEFREALMEIGRSGYTVLSPIAKEALGLILKRTGLSLKDAVTIEDEVLSAFRRYERLMVEEGLKQYPLSSSAKKQLAKLQQVLDMTDTDISELNNYIVNFLSAYYKKIQLFAWGRRLIFVGVGSQFLFYTISLIFRYDDSVSSDLLFNMVKLSILLIILGWICLLAGGKNPVSYESYMVMRYGKNWK